jgi:predicted regulator of Ras-like GTPase activity (Roadblock/LC7/MglB family)
VKARRSRNAETGDRRTQNPIETRFPQIVAKLRRSVKEIQAVLLAGPRGLINYVVDDPAVKVDTLGEEYGTLLRIARSSSEDSGAGSLVENILVSEKSVMIARRISPDHYLILVSSSSCQIGRARYELKQAVWEIQKK